MSVPAQLLELAAHITPRPYRVTADERPLWRISVVLLAVPYARGGAANRAQLHVLYWAARSHRHATQLAKFMRKGCKSLFVPFNTDPSTDVAIALAGSSRLLARDEGGRLSLTDVGSHFRSAILAGEALMDERERLELLPKKLTLGEARSLWRAT
ncbi:MAG: hypothetical protein RLO52_10765 [Sandaracinaceae bacterium]